MDVITIMGWLFFCFLAATMAKNTYQGYWKGFFLCVIISPLFGFLAILFFFKEIPADQLPAKPLYDTKVYFEKEKLYQTGFEVWFQNKFNRWQQFLVVFALLGVISFLGYLLVSSF